VKTLGDCLQLSFKRIQFTPDLPPADLVGTQIYQPQTQSFTVKKGPLFANLILADEITARRPSAERAARVDAGEARSPSATRRFPAGRLPGAGDGESHRAGGAYPLPEAQVDASCSR